MRSWVIRKLFLMPQCLRAGTMTGTSGSVSTICRKKRIAADRQRKSGKSWKKSLKATYKQVSHFLVRHFFAFRGTLYVQVIKFCLRSDRNIRKVVEYSNYGVFLISLFSTFPGESELKPILKNFIAYYLSGRGRTWQRCGLQVNKYFLCPFANMRTKGGSPEQEPDAEV